VSHWILTPTGAFRAWATVLMVLAGFGVGLGLTIGYVGRVQRDAERRNVERAREICGIVRLLDDRNQEMPPTADKDAADFRAELHRYRVALGC
jgi:uncharacterized protein (DUF1501 family)